jgi:hypothetical protein
MGLSCRRLFLANDGEIYRMSNAKFDRMIRSPASERVAHFAGQRIRSAEVLIEIVDRKPWRVYRTTFTIFQFDQQGCVDAGRYEEQQMAMVEVMIAPVLGRKKSTKNIVDAKEKFVAQGGSWSPAVPLKNQIEKAAMGLLDCPLL